MITLRVASRVPFPLALHRGSYGSVLQFIFFPRITQRDLLPNRKYLDGGVFVNCSKSPLFFFFYILFSLLSFFLSLFLFSLSFPTLFVFFVSFFSPLSSPPPYRFPFRTLVLMISIFFLFSSSLLFFYIILHSPRFVYLSLFFNNVLILSSFLSHSHVFFKLFFLFFLVYFSFIFFLPRFIFISLFAFHVLLVFLLPPTLSFSFCSPLLRFLSRIHFSLLLTIFLYTMCSFVLYPLFWHSDIFLSLSFPLFISIFSPFSAISKFGPISTSHPFLFLYLLISFTL